MHLRRALLLFAIVLGLAAITASISRPEDSAEEARRPEGAPPGSALTVRPGSASADPAELTLDAVDRRRVRLETGQPGTLLVEVEEPGQVEIPELGLNKFAEPLTPARFELLVSDPGRYEVIFTSTEGDEPRRAGTIVVDDT